MTKKKVDRLFIEFETNRQSLEFVNKLLQDNEEEYDRLVNLKASLETCRDYINKQ